MERDEKTGAKREEECAASAMPHTASVETPPGAPVETPPKAPPCRCAWVNLKNPLYVQYHDTEWGIPQHDDRALFELLILEGFQAGLSWECVLNKRAHFREVYDGFDVEKVSRYGEEKIAALLSDAGIIRNRRKVLASITNANIFRQIQAEYGSFDAYIWHFTGGKRIDESYTVRTTSPLSDEISNDLKKRGMGFVGSTVIYSYLQAIGILNAHGPECGCCPQKQNTAL